MFNALKSYLHLRLNTIKATFTIGLMQLKATYTNTIKATYTVGLIQLKLPTL